jgi:Protein of unknown function (DUF1360)
MMTHQHLDSDARQARATKLTLMSVFVGVLGTFAARLVKAERDVTPRPFELVLLGLASFRVGRMIAFEGVAAPIREPFTETRPDGSGAGQTVVASGRGARRVFAGLVYGLHLLPRPTRLFLTIMGTTGVAELCYSLTEALDWNARAARHRCS